MFKSRPQMLLLVVLVGVLLAREARLEPGRTIDEGFANWVAVADGALGGWLTQRGWRTAPQVAPVTLVAIDDSSLASHAWPWTPLDFSLFFQALLPLQPGVVVIEEVLDWERAALSPGDRQKLPQYERILRDALLRAPKAVLGAELGWPEDPQAVPPLQETPLLRKVQGDLREIPEWNSVERQPKEEYRLSTAPGFSNLPTGRGALHSVPLVLRYRGQVVPTLALQAAMLWHGLSADEVSVALGSHIALGDKARIPIDARGEMRVHFGVPRTTFGFDDLLLSAEQIAAKQKPSIPAEQIAGSIALLARTDRAAQTLRLGTGKAGSPGELWAAAIATIQSGAFIRRVAWWFDVALVAAAAAFAWWAPRLSRKTVAITVGAALLAYLIATLVVFAVAQLWLPILLPAGLLLFTLVYRLALRSKTLDREARETLLRLEELLDHGNGKGPELAATPPASSVPAASAPASTPPSTSPAPPAAGAKTSAAATGEKKSGTKVEPKPPAEEAKTSGSVAPPPPKP